MEFLFSTGKAEIGADSEEFNGGNKNEDGISDFGAYNSEECDWPEEDIYFVIIFISLLDREYIARYRA
jgi:hypothetical protein